MCYTRLFCFVWWRRRRAALSTITTCCNVLAWVKTVHRIYRRRCVSFHTKSMMTQNGEDLATVTSTTPALSSADLDPLSRPNPNPHLYSHTRSDVVFFPPLLLTGDTASLTARPTNVNGMAFSRGTPRAGPPEIAVTKGKRGLFDATTVVLPSF